MLWHPQLVGVGSRWTPLRYEPVDLRSSGNPELLQGSNISNTVYFSVMGERPSTYLHLEILWHHCVFAPCHEKVHLQRGFQAPISFSKLPLTDLEFHWLDASLRLFRVWCF